VTVANVRRECPTCGTTYGTPVDGKPMMVGLAHDADIPVVVMQYLAPACLSRSDYLGEVP
jgi:hypothetical protein